MSSMPENHDKWMVVMQQQRNEQPPNVSHLQNYASAEVRFIYVHRFMHVYQSLLA